MFLYIKMFLSKFKTNSMFHSYDTWTKSDLFITNHNTKLFEQSCACLCIAYCVFVYNKLPNEIKSVKSIIKFKNILCNFQLEKSLKKSGRIFDSWLLICRNWVKEISLYCNCQCFILCAVLINVLCGPVHVCNYIGFTCLFAFTVTFYCNYSLDVSNIIL
jgi:hypothetical protein